MEYINGELERKSKIFKRSREHAIALQPCPGIILNIKLREIRKIADERVFSRPKRGCNIKGFCRPSSTVPSLGHCH